MRKALILVAVATLATSVAACGSDDGDEKTPDAAAPIATTTTPPPAPTASAELTIRMTEFAFAPKDSTAKAGEVKITAPNDGKVVHELVVLKTDADPAKLPLKEGEVDESTSVGEVADVEAGASKSVKLKLEPGKYAIVCALPGHYQSGMYGSITVQ